MKHLQNHGKQSSGFNRTLLDPLAKRSHQVHQTVIHLEQTFLHSLRKTQSTTFSSMSVKVLLHPGHPEEAQADLEDVSSHPRGFFGSGLESAHSWCSASVKPHPLLVVLQPSNLRTEEASWMQCSHPHALESGQGSKGPESPEGPERLDWSQVRVAHPAGAQTDQRDLRHSHKTPVSQAGAETRRPAHAVQLTSTMKKSSQHQALVK